MAHSDSCVEVRNVPAAATCQSLIIYFQSRRRSGGGDIEEEDGVRMTDDITAHVQFIDKDDCENVLKRGNHSIKINDKVHTIQVVRCSQFLAMQSKTHTPGKDPLNSDQSMSAGPSAAYDADDSDASESYASGIQDSTASSQSRGRGRGLYINAKAASSPDLKPFGRGRARGRGVARRRTSDDGQLYEQGQLPSVGFVRSDTSLNDYDDYKSKQTHDASMRRGVIGETDISNEHTSGVGQSEKQISVREHVRFYETEQSKTWSSPRRTPDAEMMNDGRGDNQYQQLKDGILVTGISAFTTEADLVSHFTGLGGHIENIVYDYERGKSIIVFNDTNVIHMVMSKRTFVLNGVNLNVEFVPGNRIEDMTERLTSHLQRTYGIDPNEQDYSHRYKEPLFHDDRRIGDRDNQQGMHERQLTLHISGFPNDVTESMITSCMINSIGLQDEDIKTTNFDTDNLVCFATLKDVNTLEQVLQTPLFVKGKQLNVRICSTEDFSAVGVSQQRLPDNGPSPNDYYLPNIDCSLTLHISGFQSNTSESLIRNCMINSIGLDDDDIKKVQLDKDNNVCLVQFHDVNTLEHALQTPLLVRGKQQDVRLSCPDDFSNVGVSQQRLPDNRLSTNNSSLPSFDCTLTLHFSGFQSNISESVIHNCMINSIGLDDDDIKEVQLDKDNNVCLVKFNDVNTLEHALQTPLLVGGKQLDVRLSCPDDFSNVGVSQQRLPDNRLSANNSSLPSFDCSRILHISGFKSNTSESVIHYCMINSIGLDDDDIKEVQLDKDNNVCLVKFRDVNTVDRVLETPLLVRGKQLDVRLSCPDDFSDVKMTSKRLQNSASVLDKDPMPHSDQSPNLDLCLSGVIKALSKSILKMFLNASFGQNAVTSLQMNSEMGLAMVSCSSIYVLEHILQSGPLNVEGTMLDVRIASDNDKDRFTESSNTEEEDDREANESDRYLIVEGMPTNMDTELFILAIESGRHGIHKKGSVEFVSPIEDQPGQAVIRMKTAQFAMQLIQKSPIYVADHTVIIRPKSNQSSADSVQPRHEYVTIQGISPDTSLDSLRYFLEDVIGHEVLQITYSSDKTSALVLFQQISEVDLLKRKHKLEENQVTLKLVSEPSTVLVRGIPSNCDRDFISLYFESKKSKGGNVVNANILQDHPQCAVVVFKDKRDVRNVLKKEDHTLSGNSLRVSPYYPEVGVLPKDSRAIKFDPSGFVKPPLSSLEIDFESMDQERDTVEVTGIQGLHEDEMRLLFENRKKSGGGTIKDFKIIDKKCMALVTFENEDAASRVVQKGQVSYKGQSLKMKLYIPPELDRHRIIIEGLNEDTSRHCLISFLQAKTGRSVDDILFSVDGEKALVIFKDPPDMQHLGNVCHHTLLNGARLSIDHVTKTSTIQVHRLAANIDELYLQLYFENDAKSGGGPISKCSMNKQEQYCLVTFTETSVAERVITKGDHKLGDSELLVWAYHEEFGIIPQTHDPYQPGFKMPDKIQSQEISASLIQFVGWDKDRCEPLRDKMALVYTNINWPTDPSIGRLQLCCSLNKDIPNYRKKAKTWESEARNTLKLHLKNFAVRKLDVLKGCWNEVKQEIDKSSRPNNKSVRINLMQETSTVEIVGVRDAVHDREQSIQSIIKSVDDAMKRKKEIVEERIYNLKVSQLKMLNASQFHTEMKQTFKDMTVFIDTKKCVIIVNGLPGDIRDLKIKMYERLNSMVLLTWNTNEAISSLLKAKEVQQYLVKIFKNHKIAAVWVVEEDGVAISALSQHDVETARGIMQKEVISIPVKVSEEARDTLSGEMWKRLKGDLLKEQQNMLHIDDYRDDGICITTLAENSNNILEIVNNFIEFNTVLGKFIPLEKGVIRYVYTYKKEHLRKIEQNRADVKVSIKRETSGIQVRGTIGGLRAAVRDINALVESVTKDQHVINMPGMATLFTEKEGEEKLRYYESKYSCVIETETPKIVSDADDDMQTQSVCKTGQKIIVLKKDLTLHSCDVIVNAANGQLQHIGGLAKAIVDRGGKKIQEESNAIIRKKGDLKDSQTAVTDSGSLKCKKIIHAVGPTWKNGNSNEVNVLYDTVHSALADIEKLQLKSIAFPAISSGVFGFPITKSTTTIVEAVVDYFNTKQDSQIEEVHLVDTKEDTVKDFCKAIEKIFGESKSPIERQRDSDSTKKKHTPRPKPRTSMRPAGDSIKFQSYRKNEIVSKDGIKITLKKSAIAVEQADVLVNTTGKDLNLNVGAVSSSLNAAAGPGMQRECLQNVPQGGYKEGHVVVTQGYNLSCQIVCHGSCPGWDNGAGNSEKILRQYITNCLLQADSRGLSSIAFPAIGTGNLHFPATIVAAAMFDEVYRFGAAHSQTSVKDVRFILYDKDKPTVKGFEDHLKKQSGKQKTSDRFEEDFEIVDNPAKSNHSAAAKVSAFHSFNSRGKLHEIMIDNLTVQLEQGDITKETTDAIVNSTNEGLDFTIGAVSKAIAHAAGSEVIQDCKQIGRITGDLVMSTAGNLPCKKIIHIVAPHQTSGMREWQKIIRKVLQEADANRMQSITFPAIGTGQIGASASDIANAIYEAIGYFVLHDSPKHLKLIRITIFQSSMVNDFKKAMKGKDGKEIKESEGFLKKFKKNFVGMFSSATPAQVEPIVFFPRGTLCLTLYIYAGSTLTVDNLKTDIALYCKKQGLSETIAGEWGDVIDKLTRDEKASMTSYADVASVHLNIDLNRIEINGKAVDVLKTKEEILAILRKKKDDIQTKELAEAVFEEISWEYEEAGEYERYPAKINAKIEEAHKRRQQLVIFHSKTGACTIDLSKMEETCGSNVIKVRRKDLRQGVEEFPASWVKMNADVELKLITVSPRQQEYQDVLNSFQLTANVNTVVKIERIQNPSLYQKYLTDKARMEKVNKPGTQNEKTLWHGTGDTTLNQINRRGFDRGFHGANGTAYGKGVYFAVNASYSVGYAKPNASAHRHIYRCLVLTGEYIQGNRNLVVPPVKDPNDTSILYDSVVDSAGNPQMYVVFKDCQAYPEYLITFT